MDKSKLQITFNPFPNKPVSAGQFFEISEGIGEITHNNDDAKKDRVIKIFSSETLKLFNFDTTIPASIPAGSGPSISPDDDVFKFLALTYSKSHSLMSDLQTECDGMNFTDGITNGAEWYPVAGRQSRLLRAYSFRYSKYSECVLDQ